MSVTPLIWLQPTDDVLHRGGHLRIAGLDRALALDEHALADLLREAGVVDDHRAALGVAVARGGVLQRALTDLPADQRRPKGHLGTVLTFSVPYGLVAATVLWRCISRYWLYFSLRGVGATVWLWQRLWAAWSCGSLASVA